MLILDPLGEEQITAAKKMGYVVVVNSLTYSLFTVNPGFLAPTIQVLPPTSVAPISGLPLIFSLPQMIIFYSHVVLGWIDHRLSLCEIDCTLVDMYTLWNWRRITDEDASQNVCTKLCF